jgi:hypothetical protein
MVQIVYEYRLWSFQQQQNSSACSLGLTGGEEGHILGHSGRVVEAKLKNLLRWRAHGRGQNKDEAGQVAEVYRMESIKYSTGEAKPTLEEEKMVRTIEFPSS